MKKIKKNNKIPFKSSPYDSEDLIKIRSLKNQLTSKNQVF
jgi:hypothetical protein